MTFDWFWKKRNRELEEEIQSHLQMAARDRAERGESIEQAGYAARRDFGNAGLIAETTRDMWGWQWAERVRQDVRYAVRAMGRSPGFTAVAVVTMALGIGANTAIFSLINTALFYKQPYGRPHQLMVIKEIVLGDRLNTSPAEYLDYRDRNRVFESAAGYESDDYDVTGAGEPERITGVRVTSNLFPTLQVWPSLGRAFSAAEDLYGGRKVAVLSYGFWKSHYGGNKRAIANGTIKLNEQLYNIIGVMPPEFAFPASKNSLSPKPAVWMPMAYTPDEIADRGASFDTSVIARLKPGLSLADAQRDVERIVAEFEREHPNIYSGNVRTRAIVEPMDREDSSRIKPVLALLGVAVGLVLLIACVNLANLLLARASARRREIAVRNALGAGARRLVHQLITESLVLTFCGGLVGCAIASMAIYAVSKLTPEQMIGLRDARVDGRVLLFTLAVSAITGLLCGLAPAREWSRSDVIDALKQSSRGVLTNRASGKLKSVLVIAEAALALILLIGAGLLIRSFIAALQVPPGFDPHRVTVVRTSFNRRRYPEPARRHNAERLVIEKIRSIPGITQVGLTSHVPLADERKIGFTVEGRSPNEFHWADNALVDGAYFDAMAIPLLRGRTFNAHDTPEAPAAAIVNKTMARQFWPREDAIGKRLLWGGRRLIIVGIAGDVHLEALDLKPQPMIYNSIYQVESGASTSAVFVVRTRSGASAALAKLVRQAIWSADAGLPVFSSASMEALVNRSLAARRFTMLLLASFAAVALLLAAVGLYGVLSFIVAQRTQEWGVRLALGAEPRKLLLLAAGHGLRLTILGVLGGTIGGAILASAMSKFLFGIRSFDLLSFCVAASVMFVTALTASFLPAWRASRVDPTVALRYE